VLRPVVAGATNVKILVRRHTAPILRLAAPLLFPLCFGVSWANPRVDRPADLRPDFRPPVLQRSSDRGQEPEDAHPDCRSGRGRWRKPPRGTASRIPSAVLAASAEIVMAGLAAPCVGRALPSQTKRLGTSQLRHHLSTTESVGVNPIRQVPIRWAVSCPQRVSSAPAACSHPPSDLNSVADHSAVVVGQVEVDIGNRNALLVGLSRSH
jgi:hypothetical protein